MKVLTKNKCHKVYKFIFSHSNSFSILHIGSYCLWCDFFMPAFCPWPWTVVLCRHFPQMIQMEMSRSAKVNLDEKDKKQKKKQDTAVCKNITFLATRGRLNSVDENEPVSCVSSWFGSVPLEALRYYELLNVCNTPYMYIQSNIPSACEKTWE